MRSLIVSGYASNSECTADGNRASIDAMTMRVWELRASDRIEGPRLEKRGKRRTREPISRKYYEKEKKEENKQSITLSHPDS